MQRDNQSHVAALGVKVPPFWPHKPSLWLIHLEAQFTLPNITADATKYAHLISCLDAKFSAEVEDIIVNPPSSGKYEKLKTELIHRLSVSQEQRIQQLLSQEELGDRKPTQFLRHLRSLANGDVKDDFLRYLWSRRLPSYIQAIIAGQKHISLDEAAQLADNIHEVLPHAQVAATTTTHSGSGSVPPYLADLSRQVSELSRQVAELRTSNNQFRSRSRSRSRGGNYRSRSSSRNPEGYCWYHATFNAKARKCRSPCKYPAGNETGSH